MMKRIVCAGLFLCLTHLHLDASDDVRATAPRAYRTTVSVGERDALTLEVWSPRIPAAELDEILENEATLRALNDKHLSDVGDITLDRPCRVGSTFLDRGTYRFSVVVGEDRTLTLRLKSQDATSTVELTSVPTGAPVPVIAVAAIPREDLEQFDLEVRCAGLRGFAPIELNPTRLVVSLNNTAHDLLESTLPDASIDPRAARLALGLSRKANAMTGGDNPLILDTYALALFQNGDVEEAIDAQRRAIEQLGPDAGDQRREMLVRLRAYQLARPGRGGR